MPVDALRTRAVVRAGRAVRAVLATAALATAVPLTASAAVAQHDTSTTLPDIVVTATRRATPTSALAARVTVLDGAALRARGITRLADALRDVPSLEVVQVGSTGGLTSLFLRGGESDYVQVLVDGAPVNAPGGAIDVADLSLDNVERIEIVRGPASVLYGSDAVAGVIQVFTRRGRGSPRIDATVQAGTYGTVDLSAGVHGGDARVGYAVTAGRMTTDGLYEVNNAYRNATASARMHATPDDRTTVDLSLRYTDTEYHFPTDGAGNVVDANAFRLGTRTLVALDLARHLSDRVEGRLLLTSNSLDDGFDDRPDHAGDTLGFFGARSQADLSRHGADARTVMAIPALGHVTFGAAVEREQERSLRQDFSEFGTFTGGTDTTVSRLNHAYYAQLLVDRGPIAANAGARLDVNEEFGTFMTVRGGVTWRLATGTRLYASAGTAFKEPTFFHNFGGAGVVGNPDLEPERSFSIEGGVEQSVLSRKLVLAATAFRQRFRDLIDFTVAPADGGPNYFNVAAASADGVEFEAAAQPIPALLVKAGYTWLHTVVTDSGFDGGDGSEFGADQRLLRRPKVTVSFQARYRALERATVGAAVRRISSRDDLDFSVFPFERVTLPPYMLVDLSTEITALRSNEAPVGVIVIGRVENVFDETYQQALGFRTRGRTVLIGGRLQY